MSEALILAIISCAASCFPSLPGGVCEPWQDLALTVLPVGWWSCDPAHPWGQEGQLPPLSCVWALREAQLRSFILN